MSSTHAKYPIGIDLGTANCSVAVFKNGRVEVIQDLQGNRRIPSYVAFTDSEYLVGIPARSQAALNPSNTVHSVKRLLGRKFDDHEVTTDKKLWPFSVIDEKGRPKIQVEYKKERKEFCPEEITALILTEMKEMAEPYIGNNGVVDVVISVPANFNNLQRKATMDAAHIAGLNVLHLMNDSTAAALAYCTEKKITDTHNLLVIDLGGGSFDVSMVSIQEGKLQVKAVSGETHLGGEDFVNNMLRHTSQAFQQNENTDSTNKVFFAKLKDACEVTKKELSKLPEARINVDGCDHSHNLNVEMFNTYNAELYNNIMKCVDKVLKDSGVSTEKFTILLVGGGTRVLKIEELLRKAYRGVRISKGINRDEAVAYGAAVQAALMYGDKSDAIKHIVEIQDIKPKSLSIRQGDKNMRICIPEHGHIQHLAPIRYSIPVPKQDINVNVQIIIGSNGVLKFIHSSQEEIIDDKNCISKKDIDKMKKTAKELKNDCKSHKERMQCRNNLEECIIKVQTEFKNNVNNEEIMGECQQILDWMSSNEGATKEQYESKQKELKTLRGNMLAKVPTSRSLSLKAFQKYEISKTDPKSASTNNLNQVQPIKPEVESSEKQNETNTVSMPKLNESQDRAPLDSKSHDTLKTVSQVDRPPTPLDSTSHETSKSGSLVDRPTPLVATSHDAPKSAPQIEGPPLSLYSTSHDTSKSAPQIEEPPLSLDSTSHDTSKSASQIEGPPLSLYSTSHDTSKSAPQIEEPPLSLDSTSHDTSKSASQVEGRPLSLDSTSHEILKSASQIEGPPLSLDSTSHNTSKSVSQIDQPLTLLDSTSHDTSKNDSQIEQPPPQLATSKIVPETMKPPQTSGSKSHENSKSVSQIDTPPQPSGSRSHDKTKSGSAHHEQKIQQKGITSKTTERKPTHASNMGNASGSQKNRGKPHKYSKGCSIL